MKVVFIGVGHWHTRLYLNPALELPHVQVVGVADPDPLKAVAASERAQCASYVDFRQMIDDLKPDFAFVLGRHCDMADEAAFLIDRKVAFAIEKPGAMTAAKLHELAACADASGVHASVALVMRHSPMLDVMQRVAPGETVRYASFRFIAGLVERYVDDKVFWMLKRETSGGGCLLNLGVHFVDLFRVFAQGKDVTVSGSQMNNLLAGLDIEDRANVLLASEGAACSVETGYLFPAPKSTFDMHFYLRTEKHYFIARDAHHFESWTDDRVCTVHECATTNMGCYPIYTAEALRRVRMGEPPVASLHDAARSLELIEAAYAKSPLPPVRS